MNTSISQKLITLIKEQCLQPVAPEFHFLADQLLKKYADAAQAVLFYGSCLRSGNASNGIADLYVLVDDYHRAFKRPIQASLNKLLPPNVFYLERSYNQITVRSKYAVLSLNDFLKGTSTRWFHSYLWGRFAQPSVLLYARNETVATQVQTGLAQATTTFLSRVVPCLPATFSVRDIWTHGLRLSYRAELRAERPEKIAKLFDANAHFYKNLTQVAISEIPYRVDINTTKHDHTYHTQISENTRKTCQGAWKLRSFQGKMLSVLRLSKAITTFENGLDYILWKIERHSGVSIEISEKLRRKPLLAALVFFWRLYRRGAFR
ncbi:MAG: hypothetical protein QNI92_04900 [Desulfobacterales bacterium]|nr:hypothetical protein [Desulfobacterales bacterium]MDJ0915628.1 hypothetical protein [Desulfobacterales bacterium]